MRWEVQYAHATSLLRLYFHDEHGEYVGVATPMRVVVALGDPMTMFDRVEEETERVKSLVKAKLIELGYVEEDPKP